MKDKIQLYAFNQDYGWGELSFLFTATNEQLNRIWEKEVYWCDELGKHSEGTYCFDSDTVEFVDVSEEIGRELTAHRLIPYWDIGDIIARVEERY